MFRRLSSNVYQARLVRFLEDQLLSGESLTIQTPLGEFRFDSVELEVFTDPEMNKVVITFTHNGTLVYSQRFPAMNPHDPPVAYDPNWSGIHDEPEMWGVQIKENLRENLLSNVSFLQTANKSASGAYWLPDG